MLGLMQDRPLMTSSLLLHAAEYHTHSRITSVQDNGDIIHHTYPELYARTAKLANALRRLGVETGERIGTLAWNHHRHFELYYAVSGMGAVVHTINPRLFVEEIVYIVNHAADRYLFVDPGFMGLLEAIAPKISDAVRGFVLMAPTGDVPDTVLSQQFDLLSYEDLIAAEPESFDWPDLDENTASGLCYTSGTTGSPKGVLYSHRSNVLHAYAAALPDSMNLRALDVVMPAAPMFHVNAWGIPHAVTMVGGSLVLPGPHLDGASLYKLIEVEKVSVAAGVPTIWLGLRQHLEQSGDRISRPLRLIVGGSAVPQSLIEVFDRSYGVRMEHAWGMTETSPLGVFNSPKPETIGMTSEDSYSLASKQGRPICGVDIRVVDDSGADVPHDGESYGELLVRGPWVSAAYFQLDDDTTHTPDGWLRTGDVVTVDASGYLLIVDRVKDLIKSGGEWISSIKLENVAMGYPKVGEAAAVPVRHPKWDERPLLVIVPKDNSLTKEELLAHLEGKIARWWLPEDVIFVDELPHTATGKIMKRTLRERYHDYLIETKQD